ncbi:MAG: amidohydrolase family protein [Pseudotabrizicola sp.]|uniref:amidohydrolase family protein n=1 Tax=Pseudotabrizicola sp. TaxID=2939647 RepID=UPI0027309D4B|nr:amidohydrolase family protein [Pseudotabrizicola sp.]MDP2081832.1 amidohydrolase family protein [Pseudotabrizicola sp.]MDZ7573878.1 amidohydrolase family protein [Pseudotabrizicola sp.]
MSIELGPVLIDGQTVALSVAGGRIVALTPTQAPAAAVAMPLSVDAHVHLDKCFTAHRARAAKPGLFGAIEAMAADKAAWSADDLRARITRGLADAVANGVGVIRSHVDWTEPGVPLAWSVMGEADTEVTLQRAALVSLDILGDPDHGPGIAARVAADGAVLGTFIYRHDNYADHLGRVFRLAADHGLRLDFHVDEGLDADAVAIDEVARLTRAHGMAGWVLCGHACSLAIRADADRAIAQIAEAGLALTILPTTNLHLQDMAPGRSPRLRGLAPAQELRAAGVTVLFGSDNVRDPFYPYGAHDPVEMLRLACLTLHLSPGDWLGAIAGDAAHALGLPPARLTVGAPADFILIEGADWTEALSNPRAPRRIYRAGAAMTQGTAA